MVAHLDGTKELISPNQNSENPITNIAIDTQNHLQAQHGQNCNLYITKGSGADLVSGFQLVSIENGGEPAQEGAGNMDQYVKQLMQDPRYKVVNIPFSDGSGSWPVLMPKGE